MQPVIKDWKEPVVVVGFCCLAVFLFMLAGLDYCAGYGRKVGEVVLYERKSLASHMVVDYRRDEGEWGFGYFVPFAVLALLWFRRQDLLKERVKPALWSGGAVLLIGFFCYWAGYRGEQKYFGYASLQLIVLGCLLWFLGWKWFGNVFWVWALLGMMWPWRFLIEYVSAPLQLIMVKLTTSFLNLVGVGATAGGSSLRTTSLDPITSQPISLDVDVACSGMRSLFALVMIGLVFSFLRVKEEWKRWLLMALVPVVAILGNFVRMLLLYGGSVIWGTKVAIGEGHEMSLYHLFAGLVVFVVALFVMSAVVSLIDKDGKKWFKRRKKVVTQKMAAVVEE